MGKSIFNDMNGNKNAAPDMGNMMAQFNQFRQGFRGNPTQELQRLRDSGQMPPEVYNQLHGMATQFLSLFKK